jgi:hypothetical protein
MIQALLSEPKAPPFGIFVHESARAFAPAHDRPFTRVWWSWFDDARWVPLATELKGELETYFDWCKARAAAIEYEQDRIEHHRIMAQQYLVEIRAPA